MEYGKDNSFDTINEHIIEELKQLDEAESRKLSINKYTEPDNVKKNQSTPK